VKRKIIKITEERVIDREISGFLSRIYGATRIITVIM